MKLYFSPTSPFVKKVVIVAHECNVIDDIECVTTKVQPGNPNLDYSQKVNPLRQIPSLEIEPGHVLTDSFVICDYLIRRSGNLTMLPLDDDRRTSVLKFHALCNGITERAVQTRYEMSRPQENQWPAMIEDNIGRIKGGLTLLNETIKNEIDGPFEISEAAFVAMLKYLDLRYSDLDWRTNFPNLVPPFEAFSEFESVKAAYA